MPTEHMQVFEYMFRILLLLFASMPVMSAELIMVEQTGCVYCERFNREIAPAWPNTIEGQTAPLRRVNLDEPWPEDLKKIRVERFTPTFVLVDNGREVSRLTGYPGDEHFWFLIGQMLEKLEQPASSE